MNSLFILDFFDFQEKCYFLGMLGCNYGVPSFYAAFPEQTKIHLDFQKDSPSGFPSEEKSTFWRNEYLSRSLKMYCLKFAYTQVYTWGLLSSR